MTNTPLLLQLGFSLLTLITVVGFHLATKNRVITSTLIALMVAQAALASQGFFFSTEAMPPRLMFIILPSIILMLLAFFTNKGRAFIAQIDLKTYTYLHTVRIPVELFIFALFTFELMPEAMTFEGRNFDIVSGITAPVAAYFGFRKSGSRKLLLGWNFVALLLVIQVVATGIFSAPSPIQLLHYPIDNTAVLFAPYVWLPGIIVPIVIFGHLVSVIRLLRRSDASSIG